jgi:hypothetical protein
MQTIPAWMSGLDDEDIAFVRNFIISSGSLKDIASQYKVTYPTVRLRLDRLIQKIELSESNASEPYIALIKRFAINEKIDLNTAKILIAEYKKTKEDENTL